MRAGCGIDAAGVRDDFDVAVFQLVREAADEGREIARVAEGGVGLLLLLQDRHGDFGEIVEHEEIDGTLFDEVDGGFEPVAPEALAIGDADHKVSSASAMARGRCRVTSSASARISRVSSGSIRASQWPRAAAYFASSQRS